MPARLSKFSDAPCKDYVHPWTDSCVSATVGLGLHSMQESFRIYSTVYIVRATRNSSSFLTCRLFVPSGYPGSSETRSVSRGPRVRPFETGALTCVPRCVCTQRADCERFVRCGRTATRRIPIDSRLSANAPTNARRADNAVGRPCPTRAPRSSVRCIRPEISADAECARSSSAAIVPRFRLHRCLIGVALNLQLITLGHPKI